MLRITCPNCQSKLNAKAKLVGQTRNCPKCKTPVLIKDPAGLLAEPGEAEPSAIAEADEADRVRVEPRDEGEGLAQVETVAEPPKELRPPNRYLICDRQRIIAVWEGEGWQLTAPTGLISAKRNTEQIPSQGAFRLVELRIERATDAIQLTGVVSFELRQRWALTAIARGDNAILEKIVGPSGLTRDQKQLVRRYLQDSFMPDVWRHSDAVTEYLSSNDQHTQGVVADAE